MRRLITILTIMVATSSMLVVTSVEAKRLGGGGSIGMKRQAAPAQPAKAPSAQPQQAPSQAAAPTPTPAQSGFSRWLGPLAGFGLGALMMSMFGGGAMMGAIGNI